MAATLDRETEVADLKEEVEELQTYANKYLWNDQIEFYCDRLANGDLSPVKLLGAYWALLAGSIPTERLSGFVAHLENPAEFNRIHRIPALSADDPGYSGTGGYWCGGIWAPTNYMALKGLEANGKYKLAHEIAKNHLENVVKVFESDDIHWEGAEQFRQYFQLDHLTFDDKHTLWENYAPDVVRPGGHSKPGYVGWTGLPPIAVLIENVFGISQDAVTTRLTWRVRLTEDHGVRRYPFGSTGLVDLNCKHRESILDRPEIEVHSNIPIILEVIWEGGTEILKIEKE
jgi:glycogen debranching enzyme